jgi:steroid delta-isomerase-like uncharacterized protein
MLKASRLLTKIILAIVLVFLCCGFSRQEQEKATPTKEEMKAHIEKILGMWNEGNLALVDEIFAPQVVVHYSASPEDIKGLEGVKQWMTNSHTMFPDFSMTFDETIIAGNIFVVRWSITGTNTGPIASPQGEIPATGKKVHFSGVSITKEENGKIVEEWVIYNVLDMMMQLGFTLVPPQMEKQE